MKEPRRVIKEYEEALDANRIIGSRCECNDIAVPPRPICRKCGSDHMEFIDIKPKGTLLSWTVINIAPPSHTDKAPYILGIVQLEENAQCLLGTVMVEEPYMGMPLGAEFDEGEVGTRRLRWRG